MSYKTLFKLIIQIFGLNLIFRGIIGIPQLYATNAIFSNQMEGLGFYGWTPLIGAVIIVFVGVLLVYFANKLTSVFAKDMSGEVVQVSKEGVIEIALVLMGLIVITGLISDTFNHLASIFYGNIAVPVASFLTPLVLAGILIWKAGLISRFIVKINTIKKD